MLCGFIEQVTRNKPQFIVAAKLRRLNRPSPVGRGLLMICFQRNPHNKHMSTKVEATIEDLYKVEGKAELVNGEIILMYLTGSRANYAGGEIFSSLREYSRRRKFGRVVTDNAAFVVDLPHRKSFSPDAAFH